MCTLSNNGWELKSVLFEKHEIEIIVGSLPDKL